MDEVTLRYPRFYRRLQAAIIDAAILLTVFFGVAAGLTDVTLWGGYKGLFVLLIFIALEPGLVSLTGGTVGHHLLGIRVQNKSNHRNLNVVFAIIRFVLKSTLGLFSFVFMMITRRHQALHDLASGSVVVLKHPNSASHQHALAAQEVMDENYEYPKWYQRVVVILVYNVIFFILIGLVLQLLLSENCIFNEFCNPTERVIERSADFIILGAFALFLVLGWKGRLFGARRHLKSTH
ncbi:MAG: RDD family protein [Pseudomonadota bacterium]